jgi:acyl carrier protein
MKSFPARQSRVRAAVHEIVAVMAPAGARSLSDDAQLVRDLGFDSLRLIELTVVVEKRFALPPISLDQALAVATLRDLVNLVADDIARRDA